MRRFERGKNRTVVSRVQLSGGQGHGSTNTRIRALVTLESQVGDALSVTQSTATGDFVTVNKSGWYSVQYSDGANVAANFGITINSSQLTTSLSSSDDTKIIARGGNGGGVPGECSTVRYFNAGDVIRPHTDGGVNLTTGQDVRFKVERLPG